MSTDEHDDTITSPGTVLRVLVIDCGICSTAPKRQWLSQTELKSYAILIGSSNSFHKLWVYGSKEQQTNKISNDDRSDLKYPSVMSTSSLSQP
jgi:hypothetical protein